MRDGVRLDRRRTALVVVDVQERLFRAMDAEQREGMVHNLKILATAARRLAVPLIVTEQYPKGLGHTLPEVREALGAVEPLAKVAFSCVAVEGFAERLRGLGVQAVVLAGIETHVCVLMTAFDLSAEGFTVHVPADATVSRTRTHWEYGLALLRDEGVVVTTTETVVFQLLRRSDTDDFRALAPILK
jgi:nicotinamidase-related amidase